MQCIRLNAAVHLTKCSWIRLDVPESGLEALKRLSNGDMRKALNILQVLKLLGLFIPSCLCINVSAWLGWWCGHVLISDTWIREFRTSFLWCYSFKQWWLFLVYWGHGTNVANDRQFLIYTCYLQLYYPIIEPDHWDFSLLLSIAFL